MDSIDRFVVSLTDALLKRRRLLTLSSASKVLDKGHALLTRDLPPHKNLVEQFEGLTKDYYILKHLEARLRADIDNPTDMTATDIISIKYHVQIFRKTCQRVSDTDRNQKRLDQRNAQRFGDLRAGLVSESFEESKDADPIKEKSEDKTQEETEHQPEDCRRAEAQDSPPVATDLVAQDGGHRSGAPRPTADGSGAGPMRILIHGGHVTINTIHHSTASGPEVHHPSGLAETKKYTPLEIECAQREPANDVGEAPCQHPGISCSSDDSRKKNRSPTRTLGTLDGGFDLCSACREKLATFHPTLGQSSSQDGHPEILENSFISLIGSHDSVYQYLVDPSLSGSKTNLDHVHSEYNGPQHHVSNPLHDYHALAQELSRISLIGSDDSVYQYLIETTPSSSSKVLTEKTESIISYAESIDDFLDSNPDLERKFNNMLDGKHTEVIVKG